MKLILLTLCFIAAATAAFVPYNTRSRRDVSELPLSEPVLNYLPPEPKLDLPTAEEIAEIAPVAEEEAPAEAPPAPPAEQDTVLGENGYEYRTVRRLRFRNRRDVSHLNLEYLPPVTPPAKDYLPPKPINEYLPPVVENIVEETEAPAVETEAPEIETEAPTTTELPTTEAPVEIAAPAFEGYHYEKPAVIPDLTPAKQVEREYLPPIEEGVAEAEGPDGYRYRTFRRVRY